MSPIPLIRFLEIESAKVLESASTLLKLSYKFQPHKTAGGSSPPTPSPSMERGTDTPFPILGEEARDGDGSVDQILNPLVFCAHREGIHAWPYCMT